MSRHSASRVGDALEAIEKCQRYFELLVDDPALVEMAEDAIERNLQILGEAVNHLPAELTDDYPNVEWVQIRGFRNILVHQYFGVDISIVRSVVNDHLPLLQKALIDMQMRLE